uniref:Putative salivary gland-associated protein n=1 Tax=Amblyomma cajennense TaxID=34607 RepID=A0A023FEV9_AMBCJ
MRAFLAVCLLSAVCLANARRLGSQGDARARANARLFAGAEAVGPSGQRPGVTYSIGGNAGGQIGGHLGTGLEGTGWGKTFFLPIALILNEP